MNSTNYYYNQNYTDDDKKIYGEGKIYAIKSLNTSDIYIGSTVLELDKALESHVMKFNNPNLGFCSASRIFECGDYYIELLENYPCEWKNQLANRKQEWVDYFSEDCINEWRAINSKEDRKNYKRQYYQDNKEVLDEKNRKWCINNQDKVKTYLNQYYIDNKEILSKKQNDYRINNREKIFKTRYDYYLNNQDKIRAKSKEYCINNKDKINASKNAKINCECGGVVTNNHFARHRSSMRHQKYLASKQ